MKKEYESIINSARALLSDVLYLVSNLANISALLYDSLEGLNWSGFYLMYGGELWLGPFVGKPACVKIPLGKGVCGTAALNKKTLIVKNVHDFPGHIECDSASNSEIVVPIVLSDRVVGVLDIDSPHIGRFTEEDREGLEALVTLLEEELAEQFTNS